MTYLLLQIGVGLIGLAAVVLLIRKATKAGMPADETGGVTIGQAPGEDTMIGADLYIYYVENLDDLNRFFEQMVAEEEGSPIADAYRQLERIGAGPIVPHLKDAEAAYVECHRELVQLDWDKSADRIAAVEAVCAAKIARAEEAIRATGISVAQLMDDHLAQAR